MTNATDADPKLKAEIEGWAEPFKVFAAEVLGESTVELDQTLCQKQECVLGNFMADAMLAYRLNQSDTADFALINSGGIRATIDVGPITRGEVLTSFPFGNSIVEIEVTGEELWSTLEGVYSAFSQFNQKIITSKIQVSKNINITWDSAAGNGTKLVSVSIAGAPLVNTTTYNIVTLDFLAGGKYTSPLQNPQITNRNPQAATTSSRRRPTSSPSTPKIKFSSATSPLNPPSPSALKAVSSTLTAPPPARPPPQAALHPGPDPPPARHQLQEPVPEQRLPQAPFTPSVWRLW